MLPPAHHGSLHDRTRRSSSNGTPGTRLTSSSFPYSSPAAAPPSPLSFPCPSPPYFDLPRLLSLLQGRHCCRDPLPSAVARRVRSPRNRDLGLRLCSLPSVCDHPRSRAPPEHVDAGLERRWRIEEEGEEAGIGEEGGEAGTNGGARSCASRRARRRGGDREERRRRRGTVGERERKWSLRSVEGS